MIKLNINNKTVERFREHSNPSRCIAYHVCRTALLCDIKRFHTCTQHGISLQITVDHNSAKVKDITRNLHSLHMFNEKIQNSLTASVITDTVKDAVLAHSRTFLCMEAEVVEKFVQSIGAVDILIEHITGCTFSLSHDTSTPVKEMISTHIQEQNTGGLELLLRFHKQVPTQACVDFVRHLDRSIHSEFS